MMRKVLTTTLAVASVLALGSGAMAQSLYVGGGYYGGGHYDGGYYRDGYIARGYHGGAYGSDWMAAAPAPVYGSVPFNLANPIDAYDVGDTRDPFGGARPGGTAQNSSSQPFNNPALDRAKGHL